MKRIGLAPVVGLVLALAASGGIFLFQQGVAASSNAQLTLVRAQNELNELQALPWEVENPRFASPARLSAMIHTSELRILASINRLGQSAPSAELQPLDALLKKNFASLARIYAMGLEPGGWTAPGPTNAVTQMQNVSLKKTEHVIDNAGSVYAHRVQSTKLLALIGGIGMTVSLLAAFMFYYRRSRRLARSQERTLAAKQAANVQLEQTLAALGRSQMERDRLLERTVEVAEHERIRLAMDLHDGPIQQLTVLALNIDRLARRITPAEDSAAETLMTKVRSSLSGEMIALRRLMVDLHPPILDEGGLAAALSDAAGMVFEDTPIEWSVHCEIERNHLVPELETVIYRVAYEALVNVRKHSEATHVDVDVDVLPAGDLLEIVIADNGSGFDSVATSEHRNGEHYGILGIRERVAGLSGTCRIDSRPGAGTRVEVWLPMKLRNVEEVNEHAVA